MTSEPALAAREHRLQAERFAEQTLWDDAVREYEAALSIVSSGDAPDEDEAALLTALGSCYWNLSEPRTAWRTLRRAITLYRERGDGVGVARATVEILRIWGPPDRQRAMTEDALEALGDADPYLKARLLLRHRWFDDDPEQRFEQALAIAREHGFEDILAAPKERAAWGALDNGRIDEAIPLALEVHETFARMNAYDAAAGVLRGVGFATMAHGHLDRGAEIARQCRDYAASVHLRFTEHLALMDLAGEAYARGNFDRCLALVDEAPDSTDFRGDLYRMWMTELRGDSRAALTMMVDPERSGRTPTAISQIHGAAAGVLFRTGNEEAANEQLAAWFEASAPHDSLADEAPALFECIAALGDDEMVRRVYDAYRTPRPPHRVAPAYATLLGRATAPTYGAMCVRLNKLEEAERVYSEGAGWCERERVPIDLALCLAGLAEVANRTGSNPALHLARAGEILAEHSAKLYLDRLPRVTA